MGRPLILAVDDEEASLDDVEHELRKRYGGDYDIVGLRSASAARLRLREMKDADRPVAVVLADQWMPEMTGIELLASVRAVHPTAKRAVLASRLDWSSRPHIVEATGLGEIDGWVPKPTQAPDEHFHRLMTELLDEWSRAHGDSRFVAVRVVGEQWAPRCHELRDLLGRNGVAFEFADAARPRAATCSSATGWTGPAFRWSSSSRARCWSTPPTRGSPRRSPSPTPPRTSSTWRSWAPARPGWPRRCTRPPKACPPSSSIGRPSEARPAPAPASATTWGSPGA